MADSPADVASKDAPKLPKKKSLFSNPTWSKPQESEEGIEFFSRAKELYPMRIAEEERRRQRKLAKQKQERKRSTASAERRASSTPDIKRQRVSSDAPDNSSNNSPSNQRVDDVFSSNEKIPRETPPTEYAPRTRPQGSPTRSSHYAKDFGKIPERGGKQKSTPKNVISLSDSEDDNKRVTRSSKPGPQTFNLDDDNDDGYFAPPPIELEEEDPLMSDEEFPELVQRAREREKQKELERLSVNRSFGEKNHMSSKPAALPVDDIFQDSSAPEVDPIVEILVTSCMEGTNPLLVRRRLNQRLKEVRLSWCDKQSLNGAPFPPHMRPSIFLTWNGKRLFDASTCKHLGIKLGSDGRFSGDGEGFDDSGRLHFEAWTEDLFMAYQNQVQSQQEGGEGEEEAEETQEPADKIRLFLKGRDTEPFRIRVKPSTTVDKIILAFRNGNSIPVEQPISLYFDGEKMDPGLRIDDSELADMDTVEVHLK